MDQLKFSSNWNNKLRCNVFSTIRKPSPIHRTGRTVNVIVDAKGKITQYGKGRYLSVKTFYMYELTESAALLDSGLPKQQLIAALSKMYKFSVKEIEQMQFIYILVERIKETSHQQTLF